MKKSFLLLLLIAVSGWSQKTYTFDYLLHYKVSSFKDSAKVVEKSYLINSKDNSYFASVTKLDSLHFRIDFDDYRYGVHFKIKVLKLDYISVKNIEWDCSMVNQYKNPFKYKIKNYDFSLPKDTVINKVKLMSYRYTSNNMKRAFRMKFGTLIYVVDTSIFFKPLLSFVTAYEDWNANPILPLGLLKESHFYNYLNKLESSEIILNYEKIQRSFIFPNECTNQNGTFIH